MVHRFLLYRVDTETTRTPIGMKYNRPVFISPYIAEPPLTFIQRAYTGANVAPYPAINELCKKTGGVHRIEFTLLANHCPRKLQFRLTMCNSYGPDHCMKSKPAAVAGYFYPEDAEPLKAQMFGYLRNVLKPAVNQKPRALLAPHAGYNYSGPTAAYAFQTIKRYRMKYKFNIVPI